MFRIRLTIIVKAFGSEKKMKRFVAVLFNDKEIQLQKESDIEELYLCITKEQDFIIQTKETSIVVMVSPLVARFKNGEIKISAKNTGGE